MPPSAPVIEAAIVALASPQSFTLTGPVAAKTLLSVVVGDGFGYANVLTGVSDTQGNVYNLDSAINEADGDGSIYIARSRIATPLTTSDSLELTWSGGSWAQAYVIATPFSEDIGGLDIAGVPHGLSQAFGTPSPVSVTASTHAQAGELAIAYAVTQRGPLDLDLTGGWVPFLDNLGDSDNIISAAYQFPLATGSLSITATNENTGTAPASGDGDFGAAVVCSYTLGGGGGQVVGVPSVVSGGEVQAGVIRRPDFYP